MNKKVKERNTRISCISRIRTANMIFKGVVIGTISEETNDAGEFDWVIRPNWENLKKVPPIQIPGIDMNLKKEEYIRRYVPVIVEQRTFPDKRENLYEELSKLGLTWNDRFETMCRTGGKCGNNDILIERVTE